MSKAKIAITVDEALLKSVDEYVQILEGYNRSRFFEEAVAERVERYEKHRLSRELDKIETAEERKTAEEGLAAENEIWPEY